MLRRLPMRGVGARQALFGRAARGPRARPFSSAVAEPARPFAALGRIHSCILSLRKFLDDYVVGQDSVKEAILLGLLAREHVYIEGPPGVAKTYIAELVSTSTKLNYWFYQMHRDTRINEIIGESVIVKGAASSGHGEVIRQDIIRGGILDCELAVLDDISRTPGEALNVLLRILNERKYGNGPDNHLPLLSAIATSNPAQDDSYYAEPLDPATLDRFTLQVKVAGLISKGRWEEVERVIDTYSGARPPGDTGGRAGVTRELVVEAGEMLPHVALGGPTKAVLVELLRVLNEEHMLGEENSLLTDRTFLIKSVKILKAHALLNGRSACEPQDLYAMRFLTTFRVPSKVHVQIEQIIADILAKAPAPSAPPASAGPGSASGDDAQGNQSTGGGEGHEAKGETTVSGNRKSAFASAAQALPARASPGGALSCMDEVEVEGFEYLLARLKGHMEKGAALQVEQPGGLPRTWTRLRALSDVVDADPVSTALWCESPVPALPRSQRRTRPDRGGRLAIIRDTSLSMGGPWNDWAARLCPKVVELARKRRMHVGYLEFNDRVDQFLAGDAQRFFSREYDAMCSRMQRVKLLGFTNYELPLEIAMSEFNRRTGLSGGRGAGGFQARRRNQHILFLTDGHPSCGDTTVARQIRAAEEAGVALHTVYIGRGECPEVLDRMSIRTKGSRHAAQFLPGTASIHVRERSSVGHGQ